MTSAVLRQPQLLISLRKYLSMMSRDVRCFAVHAAAAENEVAIAIMHHKVTMIIATIINTITMSNHAVCFDGIHTNAAAPTTWRYVSCVMLAYLRKDYQTDTSLFGCRSTLYRFSFETRRLQHSAGKMRLKH